MKTTNIIFFFFLLHPIILFGQNYSDKIHQIEYADSLHGVIITDPYHWMEDIRSREVLKFVKAENRHTQKAIKSTKQLSKDFLKEENERKIITQPRRELFDKPDGEYIYYTQQKSGSTLHYRKKRTAPDSTELLLDEKKALIGKKDFELLSYKLSPNQQKIAYLTGHFFLKDSRMCIKYQISSKTFDEEIINATFYEWINDSTIVYVQYNRQLGVFDKVYIHKLGTPQHTDSLIYEEKDKTFNVDVSVSYSRKYLFIQTSNAFTSETYYMDIFENELKMKIITSREDGHNYVVYHDVKDTVFYIKTNLNAPNYKIITTSIHLPEKKNWINFFPESDNFIESVETTGSELIISEYGNGSMKLSLIEKHSGNKKNINVNMDDKTYHASIVYIDTLEKIIRLKYCSYITPDTYYDYDISTEQMTKIFETQVKNYQKSDYIVEYVSVTSHDGFQIPVTIIYNKNTPLDATSSVDIRIYGAYGFTALPRFYPSLQHFSFLDKGFIWVIPDLRGGGGLSSKRHREGTVLDRKNSVYDLVAVVQFLIDEKYTSAGKIHAQGSSAGGLTVGMAANIYPEYFASLIFFVPKLDVMFDTDPIEWLQNGNPNIKEEFDYMLGYSPYQNVKEQAYPAMQFMTGLNDINTPPFETFKMVAKIKSNQTGNAPVFLTTDLKGDHYRLNYKKMIHPYVFKLAIHLNMFSR